MDLGSKDILGQAFAVYPYLMIHCINTRQFQLNVKVGAGMSFITKRYSTCDTLPQHFYGPTSNTAISTILNTFVNTAVNFNFNLMPTFALHAEIGYMHMSNGSIIQPNGGINVAFASVGGTCLIRPRKMITRHFRELPYKWGMDLTVSGGHKELYYRDGRGYLIGSLHFGIKYNICNWYALGGGFDGFYNGVFNRQGTRPGMTQDEINAQRQHTLFERYLILEDDISNKFRFGIAINNEFKIGRITAILDWGVYLYDPIRFAYTDADGNKYTKRPLFYKYDINEEDGWNYFRLGARCRIWDNIYIQATVKSHLTKAELFEWGIGYQIPWKLKHKKDNINVYEIYHPDSKH